VGQRGEEMGCDNDVVDLTGFYGGFCVVEVGDK